MRYCLTPVRITIIKKCTNKINTEEGVEKREPSYTVGGNVNWCSHYREQYEDSLKKTKMELVYDPAIPLLGIYPKKTSLERYMHPNVHSSTV